MADFCRSCDAPVEWARTGLHADGNLVVGPDGAAHVTDNRPARRTHFMSCPNAAEHRRKKTRR